MPRASDASSRSNGERDMIRNMVTAPFMMTAGQGRRGGLPRHKPFSDNRKSVPETVFQNCPNGF